MKRFKIREIQPEDNQGVARLIRNVLVEMGVPKIGTAYEDKSLEDMHATYDHPRMKYFVVQENGKLIGSAGIAPLTRAEEDICELQKMYFLPEARGRGIGSEMMQTCINYAKSNNFKRCYLETLPYMENARKLYARNGFQSVGKPMGETGHFNCSMWMLKDLE